MKPTKKASKLSYELSHFTGTSQWYRWSSLFSTVCTDGVKYLAEEGRAYWLLDAIAAHQINPIITSSERLQQFQIWEVLVEDHQGQLECREDTNLPPAIVQQIPLTDFPFSRFKLYCVDNVILLPSEY